jgi:nucleotide-binding universal stress UspA family protein
MSTVAGASVTVGVDGSECSLAAVRQAAAEAARAGRPLRIVHAFVWPLMGLAVGPAVTAPADSGLRFHAEQLLAEAEREARKEAPEVLISTSLLDGAAVPVLLRESRHSTLLVLGDRGLGGFSGLIVGSVAVQAAAHAACPVLIVRGEEHPAGPVVVGADGSEVSALAVGYAVEQAARRGTDLVAVHAWNEPVSAGPGDMLPLVYDPSALRAEAERVLSESLAGWGQRYPDVVIRSELVHGSAVRELVDRSGSAQLLVVGARGRGGFAGLLLGSVSQSLIYHAACPVAVVRRATATA